jgi:hypothetical protein
MKKVRGMKDIENFNDENKFHIKHWTWEHFVSWMHEIKKFISFHSLL